MNRVNPQLPLGISPRAQDSFSSFFVGQNALLIDLLRETAEYGSEQQVAIWGASGMGKSHLLNAMCHAAAACGRTAACLPLAQFVDDASPAILQGMESIDLVVIDDLEALQGHADWQQALFTLINRARQARQSQAEQVSGGSSIVTASSVNPTSLELLPDLVSRLVWGPVMRVLAPGDDVLGKAIEQRADTLGLQVSGEVKNYLLSRYSRELGRLYAALAELDRASLVEQRRLTVPFVREVLSPS